MALTVNTNTNNTGIVQTTTFFFSTDSAAAVKTYVHLGFVPRYVKFVNLTDRIIDQFWAGMSNDQSLHTVAAGTMTLASSGGITIENQTLVVTAASVIMPGFLALQPVLSLGNGVTVTGFSVPASLMLASKSFAVLAIA